jgi:CBS domain-containing protein
MQVDAVKARSAISVYRATDTRLTAIPLDARGGGGHLLASTFDRTGTEEVAMKVRKIMSEDLAICTPETNLQEVAQKMVDCDCGAIPVVENLRTRKPVGMVTDRDIVCRALARGKNPLELSVGEVMSADCVYIHEDDSIADCAEQMEEHQVRRIMVVDDAGMQCGIVAQADVARTASKKRTGEVLQTVSQPEEAFA